MLQAVSHTSRKGSWKRKKSKRKPGFSPFAVSLGLARVTSRAGGVEHRAQGARVLGVKATALGARSKQKKKNCQSCKRLRDEITEADTI